MPTPQTQALRKLTYEDYCALPEDKNRYEILNGELVTTPSPKTRHQAVSALLTQTLRSFVVGHHAGTILAAPMDVLLSPNDVVQPDLLVITASRAEIIKPDNIQGAPDLLIEIASESTRRRDAIDKRKRYELFGVREYWIVDPEVDTVKVFRLAGAHYAAPAELSREAGDTLTTPLLPGFALPLADLFAA